MSAPGAGTGARREHREASSGGGGGAAAGRREGVVGGAEGPGKAQTAEFDVERGAGTSVESAPRACEFLLFRRGSISTGSDLVKMSFADGW